jgi:hypothetical protein
MSKEPSWYPAPSYDPPSAPYDPPSAPYPPAPTAPPPPAAGAEHYWAPPPPPAPALAPPPLFAPAGTVVIRLASGSPRSGEDAAPCCGCCRPRHYPHLSVPAALLLVTAFVVGTVAGSNGGDIFWAGWSGGAKGGGVSYRVTLHAVNTCDAIAGDAFCTDFFADSSVPLAALAGGPALAALTPQLQATFLGGAALAAFALLRMLLRVSTCCGGCSTLARPACGFGFALGLALCSALAAGAGANGLLRYRAAAGAFAATNAAAKPALPGVAGLALMGGYACGWVAVGAHAAAAILLLRVAGKARRQARVERQEEGRAEALLRDAGVSVQTY